MPFRLPFLLAIVYAPQALTRSSSESIVDWRLGSTKWRIHAGRSPSVTITHSSANSAPDKHTVFLDYDGSSSFDTRWAVDDVSLPDWIEVTPTQGVVPAGVSEGALFTISAAASGVAEREKPYATAVNLTIMPDHFNQTHVIAVPVLLIVAPATSARYSMWGEARQRTSSIYYCERPKSPPPVEVKVGVEHDLYFTACDSESLRVAHSLPSEGLRIASALRHPDREPQYGPQAFHVVVRDRISSAEDEMKLEYASSGRYKATVVAPLAGEHELLLLLDGTEVDVRTIVAQCPSPLVSLPDRTCGCGEDVEPGSRLYHSDEVDTVHCQPCRFGHRKPFPGNEACSLAAWLIIVVASSASVLFTIVLMVFVRRVYLRKLLSLAAVERESAEKQKRICQAVTGVTTLEFPLAVIPLSKLREQGRLIPYEEARDSGALRCCDTVESAVAFADAHPLMFVSHQWLSLRHPDPESQHYPVVIKAAEALCAMHGIDQDSMHIWLDYHSIPQENDTTKRLAIGSIALYAACSHYFLACAPEALHQDTSPPCRVDADTYLQRGWCRLEQWAFMAINGAEQMYLFESGLTPLSERRRWIEESVNVFQGDFTHESDKALLVDVVLGLYGLAVVATLDPSVASRRGKSSCAPHSSSHELIKLIADRRCLIFPRQYFGDLIERLEAELEAGSSRGRSSFGETYRAARSARQTLHNSCIVSVRKFSV